MSKSIMIDPGHGGTDPGANGFGIKEKDWSLKISLYQYERLKKLGANVGITRTTDKSLDSVTRTNLFKNKYDVAISNHWNAFNGTARGIETIHSYLSNGKFAQNIANALVKATGLPLRRVFTRKNNSGTDYYFMHRLSGNTATVIVEHGFIDNKTDNDWYKNEDNFYKAAEAVIEVVCKEVGIKYVAPDGKTTPSPSKPVPSTPTPAPQPSNSVAGAKLVKNENAFFLATENIKVRSAPSVTAKHTGTLPKGSSINYKKVYEGNGYRWLQYTGNSGNKLYLPYRESGSGKTQWGTFHSTRPSGGSAAKSAPKKTASKTAKVGDTVTAKALYGTAQSTKNVRSSNIKGYVADINNSRRNPIRLRNKKGGYYLGFTRQQDLV